jgi:hypothetical protein
VGAGIFTDLFGRIRIRHMAVTASAAPQPYFTCMISPLFPQMASAAHFPVMVDGSVGGWSGAEKFRYACPEDLKRRPVRLYRTQDSAVRRHDTPFNPRSDLRMARGCTAGLVHDAQISRIPDHAHMRPSLIQGVGVSQMTGSTAEGLQCMGFTWIIHFVMTGHAPVPILEAGMPLRVFSENEQQGDCKKNTKRNKRFHGSSRCTGDI